LTVAEPASPQGGPLGFANPRASRTRRSRARYRTCDVSLFRSQGTRSPSPSATCSAGVNEPERSDGTTTRITHTLGPDAFYFDNPNFRAREGDVVPFKDTTATVPSRINFASDLSPKFVGRDSPQLATRVLQGCQNQIAKRDATTQTVDHCGGVSVWDVASGGRMGGVFGEDATEVAPPATACTRKCQAQDQVRGQSVLLGFPFPVPAASRLQPRFP
jgi:hypothetical protein